MSESSIVVQRVHWTSNKVLPLIWLCLLVVILLQYRVNENTVNVRNRDVNGSTRKKISPTKISNTQTYELANNVVSEQQQQQLLIPEAPDLSCPKKVLSAIEGVIATNESRFARCPVTSQVQISIQDNEHWILQSLDENGDKKTVGGDEYYIFYTDYSAMPDLKNGNVTHATMVARAIDQSDGTYMLQFVTSPMQPNPSSLLGIGRLTIHFEYTCGVGRMGQPMKNKWNSAGYTHTVYHVDDVQLPFYRAFQPPQSSIDLGSYDFIHVHGDSVMNNFVGRDENYFGKPNIFKGSNPESALNSKSINAWFDQIQREHGNAMHNKTRGQIAFIVGSSTWDVLRNEVDQWMTWSDHADAIRQLIESIRNEYPHVDLFWKSATALHICNPNVEKMALQSVFWGIERVRYMSESRSFDIDHVQKDLMTELHVPILDVYETTYLAADWSRTPTDARHYSTELNRLMLGFFYKSKTTW